MITPSPEPTLEPFSQIVTGFVRSTNWGVMFAGGVASVIRLFVDPYDIKRSKPATYVFAFCIGLFTSVYFGKSLAEYFHLTTFSEAFGFASGLISMNLILSIIKFGKTFNFKEYIVSLFPKSK